MTLQKAFKHLCKIVNRMQSTSSKGTDTFFQQFFLWILTFFSDLGLPIIVDHLGSVTIIGINRPAKRNCINYATSELLKEAIKDFEYDEKATVGVLYGVGGNFCAGYDLGELSQTSELSASNLRSNTGTVVKNVYFNNKFYEVWSYWGFN